MSLVDSHRVICLLAADLLCMLAHPAGAVEAAPGPSRVQLAAYRVQPMAQDGMQKERLVALTQLRPGDTVEYEATYSNTGRDKVSQVVLTVPVPDVGLVYVAGGAQPATAWGSLDGNAYAPLPLMRVHTLPDGRRVQRPVPASEIRFLRWSLASIPGGTMRSVRVRMQLPALDDNATAAVAMNEPAADLPAHPETWR